MTERNTLTAQQIADHLAGTVVGSTDVEISSFELIERATAQHLAFVGAPRQLGRVKTTQAKLILVPEECSTQLGARTQSPAFRRQLSFRNPPASVRTSQSVTMS